jgi:Protein of unknown function (DUF2889)
LPALAAHLTEAGLPRVTSSPNRASTRLPGPTTATPARRPGSVRRTSNVDMLRPDGLGGQLVLAGRSRDLVTAVDGASNVVAYGEMSARIDSDGQVGDLTTVPAESAAAELNGRFVGAGWRTAVVRLLPTHRNSATPLHVLLDEVPVAAIISGFARLRAVERGEHPVLERGHPPANVCAGWRTGGEPLRRVIETGSAPAIEAPSAPVLEPVDDPLSWHEMAPLGARGMRRRRRLDLIDTGASLAVDAMFRDSHVDPDGAETVIHEYGVRAEVDRATLVLDQVVATPRTLPFAECPVAAASALRVAGRRVAVLRDFVGLELWGPSTCTHLNDLLRSLGDIAALAPLLDAIPDRRTG